MKKTLSALCMMMALVMLFCFASSAVVNAADKPYEVRKLTAYLFDMEHTAVYDCLFCDALPDVPYMDAKDYLSNVYTVDFTESENADGTFTVSSENGTMTVDPVSDTVVFDVYESFAFKDPNDSGSAVASTIIKSEGIGIEGEAGPLRLDCAAYQIDLIADNGRIYFPLATLVDLFIPTYNAAEYVSGNIYFLHTVDNLLNDGYFDRSSLYEDPDRAQSLTDFTYNELCFYMDHFYGKPSKAAIASSIEEKGFDKTLDEFSDDTRTAKELLRSNDVADYLAGFLYLDGVFDDGGHTSMILEVLTAITYKDSAVTKELQKNHAQKVASVLMAMLTGSGKVDVTKVRNAAYETYQTVKSWDDTARLIVDSDTAVFVFDSFDDKVAPMFKWSLDYAAENGIRNFVVDLTHNGGGSDSMLKYIYTIMTNKDNHTNECGLRFLSVASGNIISEQGLVDLNLDGEFDDRDKEVAYDFNFALLTTNYAFSCGNILPCMAQDQGIVILGETSGGGSCTLTKAYTECSHYYFISGVRKFVRADNSDSDLGAAVNFDLTKPGEEGMDYSGLFDLKDVSEKVHDYYGDWKSGDANLDGEVNIIDVTTIQRFDAKMTTLSDTARKMADVDRDGEVTTGDATWIQRWALKMNAPAGIGAPLG